MSFISIIFLLFGFSIEILSYTYFSHTAAPCTVNDDVTN